MILDVDYSMDDQAVNKNIIIAGEVVQTIKKENCRYIKIANATCIVEVSSDILSDVHLGDILVLEGSVTTKSIEQCFNHEQLNTLLDEFHTKESNEL